MGREIQVFGVESDAEEQVELLVDDNARAARRLLVLAFLFTPLYATVMLLLLIVALATIWATGLADLEELGAIILLMLRSFAYGQLAQSVWVALHGSAPFLSDLQEQLDSYRRDRVDSSGQPMPMDRELVLRGVSYSYPTGRRALDDVSFAIRSGEIIGVIGPSGSGKSTLVQLLLRLRTPTMGSIVMGGVDIHDIALDEWRSSTSLVPQEPRLLAGTIEANIRFLRRGVTRAMIEHAARLAHIHDELVALPRGYDTILGGPHGHLSGGQQQRLCIARRARRWSGAAGSRRADERCRRAVGGPHPIQPERATPPRHYRHRGPSAFDARDLRPHPGSPGRTPGHVRHAIRVAAARQLLPRSTPSIRGALTWVSAWPKCSSSRR